MQVLVPEGHLKIAQRFNVGLGRKKKFVPIGTVERSLGKDVSQTSLRDEIISYGETQR